jgi:hypothetical protein
VTEPDLVESGRPGSRRAGSVIGVLVVALLALLAWRAGLGPAGGERHDAAPGPSEPTTSAGPTAPAPAPTSPLPIVLPERGGWWTPTPQELRERGEVEGRLAGWLATMPRLASRPTTYGRAPVSLFRVRHSHGFNGSEDFAATGQLRDASGRWVDLAHGFVSDSPPIDASGRYLAFTVSLASLTERLPRTWVYIVDLRQARVITSARVDWDRYVAGWLGDRVVVGSFRLNVSVQLLDWQRPTMALEDLGPASRVLIDLRGEVMVVQASTRRRCLSVWRFTRSSHAADCPQDQVLAISPNGAWAVTQDLRWVGLRRGHPSTVGDRPPGVTARSASFLPDGRVLVDVSLDGFGVEATLLCSLDQGCRKVPARSDRLYPI